jgi:hypothetical protein
VTQVLGQQVAGKQRQLLAAVGALRQLHPEEVLHARVRAALLTGRVVEIVDLLRDLLDHGLRGQDQLVVVNHR